MFRAQDLQTTIFNTIIFPKLDDTSIRQQAKDLGFERDLNFNQAINLYNSIIQDLMKDIQAFMNSKNGEQLCDNVQYIDTTASFSPLIGRILRDKIQQIYHIDLSQPKPTTSWFWSILGYST